MGYLLYREVLDWAPADISSGERLVWAVLADLVNDKTREGCPGMEQVCRRTGFTPSGVNRALRRLADRGYDLRVELGKDKRGQTIYAYDGHRTTYRMPKWSAHRPTTQRQVVSPQADHPTPSGQPTGRPGGQPVGPQWSACGPSVVSPQADPSPQRALKEHSAAAGGEENATTPEATAVELAAMVATIRLRRPDASRNLIRHILKEDGPELLAELRGEQSRTAIRDWLDWAKTQPECEHRLPGGGQIRPDTGKRVCVTCQQLADRKTPTPWWDN